MARPGQTVSALATVLEQGHLPQLEKLILSHKVADSELVAYLRVMSRDRHFRCQLSKGLRDSLAALERHHGSLQHLDLHGYSIDGGQIQIILESCPTLGVPSADTVDGYMTQQGRSWVCLYLWRLELLISLEKCSEEEEVREQSRAMFAQLGRLAQLKLLKVRVNWAPHTIQRLDLRLESGMDQLVDLQRLFLLDTKHTEQNMGAKDVAWMRSHLKKLGSVFGRCNDLGEFHSQPR